ncbi:MAG TPA: hypothetical protein PKW07_10945 [Syntrophorhabdaceae bacterium]|nr:hypothetical protein [Syntrophorhabdaceae bacterium]
MKKLSWYVPSPCNLVAILLMVGILTTVPNGFLNVILATVYSLCILSQALHYWVLPVLSL